MAQPCTSPSLPAPAVLLLPPLARVERAVQVEARAERAAEAHQVAAVVMETLTQGSVMETHGSVMATVATRMRVADSKSSQVLSYSPP